MTVRELIFVEFFFGDRLQDISLANRLERLLVNLISSGFVNLFCCLILFDLCYCIKNAGYS